MSTLNMYLQNSLKQPSAPEKKDLLYLAWILSATYIKLKAPNVIFLLILENNHFEDILTC